MNRIQYLLGKLAGEAAEIAHIALKTQQFGAYEMCPDLQENNIERVNREFNDLLGVAELINEELNEVFLKEVPGFVEARKSKVNRYYEYSKECGQITED